MRCNNQIDSNDTKHLVCDECILHDDYKKNRIYYDISNAKFLVVCDECVINKHNKIFDPEENEIELISLGELNLDEFNKTIDLHKSLYFNDRSKLMVLNKQFQNILVGMKKVLKEMAKCKNI
jgi:hypothetical protein